MHFPPKVEEIMLPGTVKKNQSIETVKKDHIQENKDLLKLPELKEMSQSNFDKVRGSNRFKMESSVF